MPVAIAMLEHCLASPNQRLRLRAIKHMLRHPDATPVQLARCLCSSDFHDRVFPRVYELDEARCEAWARLRGVTDDEVYAYLAERYAADPEANSAQVFHVLSKLRTRRAQELLAEIEPKISWRQRGHFALAKAALEPRHLVA